ncbi:MAG: NADH-quinone oxidoreductase subunit NuoE [Candidatus Latescibacteria bacterium]|nr:NADH-quinone oxidoreductase subunit NuoE [Candidatus Latescibacterota bacterium]
MPVQFSPEAKKEFDELLTRYPYKEPALLPVLHLAQREFGHLSLDALKYVADLLELPPARVAGVATFYPMYHFKPVGKYLLHVCATLSCALLGAEGVVDYLQKKLGVHAGETTPDGRFTLLKVECVASCGTAPVLMLNETLIHKVTREKLDDILADPEAYVTKQKT